VIPIAYKQFWKIVKHGFFPLGLGNRLTFVVHALVSKYDFVELMEETESEVVKGIKF
jgi:1-acyl-sn-glycerol-3-phosphate acyltransferase